MSFNVMVQLKLRVLVVFFLCAFCAVPEDVTNEPPLVNGTSICFGCSDLLQASPNECRVPKCSSCNDKVQLKGTTASDVIFAPLLRPVVEHCKETDTIAVVWTVTNDTFYYLTYREAWGPPIIFETEPTKCGYELLTDLIPDTTYRIELRSLRITSDGRIVHGRSRPTNVRTNKVGRIPSPVASFFLKGFYLSDGTYTAHLGWSKGDDNGCYFNVVSLGGEDEGYQDIDIDNVWNDNDVNITELQFGRNYSIAISGIADMESDNRVEGPKTWLNITVPSCLQAYGHSQRCAPEQPQNLTVKEVSLGLMNKDDYHLYNVSLFWNEPKYPPNFYAANLILFDIDFSTFSLNISGNSTSAEFESIELTPEYEVQLVAFSDVGPSATAMIHRHFNINAISTFEAEPLIPTELIFIVVVPLIVAILAALFTLNYYLGKRARQKDRERSTYFKDLEDKTSSSATTVSSISVSRNKTDAWEIDTIKLIVEDILGHGAFGVVRRGWYLSDKEDYTQVAIKMLRDNPTQEELKQFHQEIEIMKNVPRHPQLVSLIGCVSNERPLLVVEYCAKGDLQSYLRSAYEKVTKAILINHNNTKSTNYAFNMLYDLDQNDLEDVPQPKDLISFARQVAVGMEYLASLKLIHRDLAARNVLVCDNKSVKISDFGLSRDVYYDDVYCKLGGGKLPIRWMALESMTHQIYTTQSDVWSFGVLLWEIATLGSTPYPGISTHDVLSLLTSGYRMAKPDDCSEEMYSIMLDCWKDDPSMRPSFQDIRNSLDGLLETFSDYLTLDEPVSEISDTVNM